jgi:ABC-type transporter Mla maintaining outer membrane lipid asymmetry ATPase subunit MlaF
LAIFLANFSKRRIRSVEIMSEPIVSIVNVEKFYGNNKVVNNLNMNIEEGETTVHRQT